MRSSGYRQDDLPDLYRFAQRIWSLGSRFHLGDLAWNLGQVPEGRPGWRMALWRAGGEVVAWGWLALPGDLSLLVDPASADLADEVLDWAAGLAAEPLTVTVLDAEKHLVAALERRGYAADPGGRFFQAYRRDLADLPPVPELPAGFAVRAVRDDADLTRHAALHREVWPRSALTDDGFRALAAGWPYRRDCDIVVEAPGGRLVAYCLGWYDDVNRVGEFEPVGTVAEYRRRGLSRAAGIAALHAFRAAGGETALVYPRGDDEYPVPRQVYAALGFTPHARTVRYHQQPELDQVPDLVVIGQPAARR
ncbi:GNAT family N-acetyltransferase [Planosporangium sp. 12N6]|uniref:GNAT family N-acetyltransferase n=1 Tax=Planosporangium spinosum TaxID=3402278 RepID=UPI003CE95A51